MSSINPLMNDDLFITQEILDSFNVEQAREDNRAALNDFGGVDGLAKAIGIDLETGLTRDQVYEMRER